MIYKDCKDMSNSEIRLYQEALTNEFEAIKSQIQKKFEELDKLDKEYNKAENELNNRKRGF